MFRRAFLPSLYDLYQMLLGVIGLIGVFRILGEYAWVLAVEYAVAGIAAFWIGQGIVALFQKTPRPSLD
jgi:hypothetical protein